jgi:hypothetical protein
VGDHVAAVQDLGGAYLNIGGTTVISNAKVFTGSQLFITGFSTTTPVISLNGTWQGQPITASYPANISCTTVTTSGVVQSTATAGTIGLQVNGGYFQVDGYGDISAGGLLHVTNASGVGGAHYLTGANVGIGTTSAGYRLTVQGDILANGGWLRVSGAQGLYFESYGGGWYMSDSTWMRTYGVYNIYSPGLIVGNTLSAGSSGPPAGIQLYAQGTSAQTPSFSSWVGTCVIYGSSSVGLSMGSQTGGNFGFWLQSQAINNNWFPLWLNPMGGVVGIGRTNDDGSGASLQVYGGITATGNISTSGGMGAANFQSGGTTVISGSVVTASSVTTSGVVQSTATAGTIGLQVNGGKFQVDGYGDISGGGLLHVTNGSGVYGYHYLTGANVGIGTTTANSLLSLQNNVYTGALGTAYNQYQILLYDNGNASGSYGLGVESYYIGYNAYGGHKFYQAGATVIATLGGAGTLNINLCPNGGQVIVGAGGIGTSGDMGAAHFNSGGGTGVNAQPIFDGEYGTSSWQLDIRGGVVCGVTRVR